MENDVRECAPQANTPTEHKHEVTIFSSKNEKKGSVVSLKEALYNHLSPSDISDKKKSPCFICGVTHNNGKNLQTTHWIRNTVITLDFDENIPYDYRERIEQLPFVWYFYPTHNHTEENPRFRIVLPLSKPITDKAVYENTIRMVEDPRVLGMKCDPCSYKVVQLFFTPTDPSKIQCSSPKEGKTLFLLPPIITTDHTDCESTSKTNQRISRDFKTFKLNGCAKRVSDAIDLVELLQKRGYELQYKKDGTTFMHHQGSHCPNSVEVFSNGTCYSHHSPHQRGSECLVADVQEAIRNKEGKDNIRPISAYDILKTKIDYNPHHPTIKTVKDLLRYINIKCRYDEFKDETILTKGSEKIENIKNYLLYFFDPKVLNLAESIVCEIAGKNSFHSFYEELRTYEQHWDRTERIRFFLRNYAGMPDTPENEQLSLFLWMGLFSKISKQHFPYVIHLVGEAGVGKTTLCKLMGGSHYEEIPPNGNKDSIYRLLARNVIVCDEGARMTHRCQRKNCSIPSLSELAKESFLSVTIRQETFST